MIDQGNSGFFRRTAVFGLAVLLTTAAVASTRAAVLASYPFTGSSLASTDTDSASAASSIVLGSGLDSTSARFAVANGNPSPALRINADETDGTTFATAITDNDFLTLTLTPAAGQRLILDNLTFDLAVNSTLVATNVRVQLSLNGTAYTTLDSVTAYSTTAFTTQTFDIAGTIANSALAAGSPLYVRFVVFDNTANAAAYTGFDNLTLNGTVGAVVPEPRTLSMCALGVLAAGSVILRRRR